MSSFLAVLLACTAADAPAVSMCPDPRIESELWAAFDGIIDDTSGGDTLIVRIDGSRVVVRLAGIFPAVSSKAAAFLCSLVGRRVRIETTRMLIIDNSPVYGVARVDGSDLTNEMLLAGLASYAEPPASTLTPSIACRYKNAEKHGRRYTARP